MNPGSAKDKKHCLIARKQKINYLAYFMKFPLPTITLAICATALSTSLQLQAGTVTNTNNSGTGSLRDAIAAATNGETIDFDPALNGATITLTSGHLFITGLEVTIDASALPAGIKISGNNSSRIFSITASSNATLNNLELFDGSVALGNNGGGIAAADSELNCINLIVRNCDSANDGGGLWASSISGTMDRCSFIGNDSGSFGGGLYLQGAPSATIQNSVISGNRASGGGGGIAPLNTTSIINCTIQGNSGSGIYLIGQSTPLLRNTIVWGNRTGSGSTALQQIQKGTPSTANADVDYCLIEGAASTLNNLNGTLGADYPKFVNPANPVNSSTPPSASADLRVFINSPVLNVGNNGSNTSLLDRAGRPRVQDTTIDLGAFEGGYVTFGLLHPTLNPTEDSNGNGISNFVEYASGTDPSGPDNPATRPMISQSGNFKFLTTAQRSNALDVIFSWETSTSLETPSWQAMVWGINYTVESTSNPSSDRKEIIFKLLDSDSHRFYRQGFLSN